jgi:hypothetical protein
VRGQPTAEDLRKVREFQEILLLPTRQEVRLALIRQEPPSDDPADCICAALKECGADSPCPYCRSNPADGCLFQVSGGTGVDGAGAGQKGS